MSRNYSVTEPHPSVPKTGGYIGGGRGGAGNFKKYSATELSSGPNASGPASRVSLTRSFKRMVAGGRGGAGNMYSSNDLTQEPMFLFDEELQKKHSAPVYHIGRGGAANFVDPNKVARSTRAGSSDSSVSINTQSSTNSVRRGLEGVVRKVTRE